MQRDTSLDAMRGLVMIHVVCVIHCFFLGVGDERVRSALLFEMPAIFFIAGAAQQYSRHRPGLKETVINRLKRVVLPFYVFLAAYYAWLAIMTAAGIHAGKYDIDITRLTAGDVIKTLATGGSEKLPFYGYTWFVSCYMIISCSFPLQLRLLRRVPSWVCLPFWALVTLVLTPLHFPAENEIKNLPVYNFFFMAGYLYYRHRPNVWLYVILAASAAFTLWGFASGFMHPMQGHKFPADIYFLIFGTAWLCFFSVLFSRFRMPSNRILRIWNVRGYNIYLYQAVTFYIVYLIITPWLHDIDNRYLQFFTCSVILFAVHTATSYFTFNFERSVCDRLLRLFTRKEKTR